MTPLSEDDRNAAEALFNFLKWHATEDKKRTYFNAICPLFIENHINEEQQHEIHRIMFTDLICDVIASTSKTYPEKSTAYKLLQVAMKLVTQ